MADKEEEEQISIILSPVNLKLLTKKVDSKIKFFQKEKKILRQLNIKTSANGIGVHFCIPYNYYSMSPLLADNTGEPPIHFLNILTKQFKIK